LIARDFGDTYPYHTLTYIGNDRWLMRRDFTSFSTHFAEVSLEWDDPPPNGPGTSPEPATLALVGLGVAGIAWRRRANRGRSVP
jgi:hypothetical protein